MTDSSTCKMRVAGDEGFADCQKPAGYVGYCRAHAEDMLRAERAYVKLHELSAGRARGKAAELEQALGTVAVPALLFHPREVIVPLETAPGLFEGEAQVLAFIADRVSKGDPGPLHFQNGLVWTEAADAELEAEEETLTEIATIRVETLFEKGGWRVQLEAPREKAAATHFGAASRHEGVAVALVLLSRVVIDRVQTEPGRVFDSALERAVEMYDAELPDEDFIRRSAEVDTSPIGGSYVGKETDDNANGSSHRT